MFFIGQKVACIHPHGWYDPQTMRRGLTGPTKGDVLEIWQKRLISDELYLSFAEWGENWFEAAGFRPLVEKKTDISVFEKLLDGSKPRVLEDV